MNGEEIWIRFHTYLIVAGSSIIAVVLLMYHIVWRPEMEAFHRKLKNKRKLASKT